MICKTPENLIAKLKTDGWKYIPRKHTDITVFQNEIGDKFFQVTIPLDRNLGDFSSSPKQSLFFNSALSSRICLVNFLVQCI